MTIRILVCVVVVAVCAMGVVASPQARSLEAQGVAAMGEGDYERAAALFLRLSDLEADSFVGPYNAACALARMGEEEAALEALRLAITRGFADKAALASDPDLDGIRGSEGFEAVLATWDDAVAHRRNVDRARAIAILESTREERTLATLRVELISAHDPRATDEAAQEIGAVASWMTQRVFTAQRGGATKDDPWVMVVLPDQLGFKRWAQAAFGSSVMGSISSLGGVYEHQHRRLVAQDLGATLRHEFVHVLHWRDMNRLGQRHAAWVQEGLASLVEDVDPRGRSFVLAPSWRTNIVKRLERVRKLPTIEQLASEDLGRFTAARPLAKYAQARTLMMFLNDKGALGRFYETYTQTFGEDPTGVLAIERVMGREIREVEMDYRAWVRALPEVAETGSDLEAVLGIGIEQGSGDGVRVTKLPSPIRAGTSLRNGSIITAIEGRAVRDMHELIRVLGSYAPGQRVRVTHRWGTVYHEDTMTLMKR